MTKNRTVNAENSPRRRPVPITPSVVKNDHNLYDNGKKFLANADSGATGNYLGLPDMKILRDVKVSSPTERIAVAVAEGTLIYSTHHGYLDVPAHGPMMAYIFPQLKGSLLSISELVNVGLHLVYCKNFVTAFDNKDNVIFQGKRDMLTGLWMVDLQLLTTTPVQPHQNKIITSSSISNDSDHQANLTVRLDSVADFVNFWHGTFGSPALSTFIPAVEKGFIRIPGLTAAKIRRHPPNPLATAYGHLDATRKGFRSTKQPATPSASIKTTSDDLVDDHQPLSSKDGRIFYRTEEVLSGRAHADAAGAFQVRSNSGALYQIIYYHEDSNIIHVETTKSRSGPDLLAALQRAIKFFKDQGASPLKIVRMDNEISAKMETWLDDSVIELELTPVAQHRTNRAERAIRTWKGHFIAIIAGIDPECPLSLWEDFIAQAELTLNLMRTSPANPMMSAWEMLCGRFDINSTPIAPLGMKVLVHDTPEKRGSWHGHGSLGFYTGRALKHYRCHTVWMKESRATRISNCLSWHPVLLKMPGSSLIEELTSSVVETQRLLAKIVANPSSAHSTQPVCDDAVTLAADLRSVRELFRPPPTDVDIFSGPPPGFPQQIPQLGPPAQPERVTAVPQTQLPAPTLPPSTAPLQRVVPVAQTQVVAPTLPKSTAPLQRVLEHSNSQVPTATTQPVAIILPLRTNQPIRPPTKVRKHHYFDLSQHEIHKVDKLKIKRIGMQFLDDTDPSDTYTGIIVSIVRHKKSRKLAYKYWDHTIHTTVPKDETSFDYMDVSYAIKNCKWSKTTKAALTASAVSPSLNTVKKAKQRARYVPWYHRLNDRVNAPTPNPHQMLHACTALDLNADGTRLTSTSALKGPDKLIWEKAHGEEIIRLVESGTGRFIYRREMPADRKAAYYNPQLKVKIKPDGVQHRVRGTIGGDKVDYPGTTTAYTAHLESIRVMLNATVSEHARIATADIKDFYLGTPLDRPEYMRISLKHIPLDVQIRYNISSKVENEHVIMEITKGIYGLPQAGKLAQDRLVKHLAGHSYNQCTNTPCLFVHSTNGVAFTLVVDDFLIKYKEDSALEHLFTALRELYVITTDLSDTKKYVGITLHHNVKKNYIDMSIPGYVKRACQRFQRNNLRKADSPIIYVPPRYGKFQQEVHLEPISTPLTSAESKELQEIVGVFLFYARAVDPTMLTAINKIASRQSKPTSLIKQEVERFFQYANTYPDATMRIRASNMKLVCHSDGSYLSESDARSRAGGMLFLGDCAEDEAPNAPVSFLSVIIKTVVSSATATEYAAAFIVGQNAIPIIHTLADLGYPQTHTEIICDNLCAVGIANNTFTMKRTKTIDMRYHWIRDQVKIGIFNVIWKPGKLNLADFFTKAHPVHHHKNIRWKYVLVEPKDCRANLEDHIPSSEGVLIHDQSHIQLEAMKI